jgi:hypothetical protein
MLLDSASALISQSRAESEHFDYPFGIGGRSGGGGINGEHRFDAPLPSMVGRRHPDVWFGGRLDQFFDREKALQQGCQAGYISI